MTTFTPVTLPNCPPPSAVTYSLVSKATEMSGPLGGPTQRVLRVGSRFKVDFEFAPMCYGDGRQWLARLLAAEATPAAILFPQRGLNPAYPGPIVVSGAQTSTQNTGGVLNIRGGSPAFGLVAGQFFHLNASADGRRYLHQLQADVALAAGGTASLAIQPPLRVAPADGDTLEFVNVTMEGFVAINWQWTIEMVNRVGLKFSVTEDR